VTSVGRWALSLLGRDPRRLDSAAACLQCGDPSRVCVLRLGPRGARYSCLRCGALITETDRAAIRPRHELLRPVTPAALPSELADLVPAEMLRWLSTVEGAASIVEGVGSTVDGSAMFRLYDRWDGLRRRSGPGPRVPSFAATVDALHDACYRTDLAVAALPGDGGPAVRERATHARRWLYLHGRALCWIHEPARTGCLAAPDRDRVEAALVALRTGARLDRDAGPALRAALFGTTRGPRVKALLRIWPLPGLVVAAGVYLDTGRRPLRVEVLATLNGTRR
jgi:hypothetical protein